MELISNMFPLVCIINKCITAAINCIHVVIITMIISRQNLKDKLHILKQLYGSVRKVRMTPKHIDHINVQTCCLFFS